MLNDKMLSKLMWIVKEYHWLWSMSSFLSALVLLWPNSIKAVTVLYWNYMFIIRWARVCKGLVSTKREPVLQLTAQRKESLGQWLLTSDPSTRSERPIWCQIPTHWMERSGWLWRRQQEVFTAMLYGNEERDGLGILSSQCSWQRIKFMQS